MKSKKGEIVNRKVIRKIAFIFISASFFSLDYIIKILKFRS